MLGRLAALSRTSDPRKSDTFQGGKAHDNAATTEVPASSPIAPRLVDDENCDIIDDAEWLDMERRAVNHKPAQVLQGSEDLLVPNSPESAEDLVSPPKLNLGRFTFAG
jgi:hypothetical protein